jgi:asparagine synthase (glutamine-hydrolysing)
MCGIIGIMFKDGQNHLDNDTFFESLQKLKHRGPDHTGISVFKNVMLGHTRLSIIDIDIRSNQPFETERFVMAYNGEIYNFIELRDRLKQSGFTFITTGDTEVVIKAFEAWGVSCFNMFNGDWAICIYDKIEEKLYTSRDRFGQKSLFYYQTDEFICFCSEVAPIAKIFKLQPDLDSIAEFILEGDSLRGRTFFESVKEFPASNYFISRNSEIIEKNKYWVYPKLNNDYGKIEDGNFMTLLSDAVNLRLKTDVGYCILLSGGIDSTIIASIVSSHLNNNNKSLTAFNYSSDDKDDEYLYAKAIADKLNINLKSFNLKFDFSEFRAELSKLVMNLARGHSSPAILSVNALYKGLSEKGFKVALDGQGADELLGGYRHYQYSALFHSILNGNFINAIKFFQEILKDFNFITIMYIRSIGGALIKKLIRILYGYEKYFNFDFTSKNKEYKVNSIWNVKEYVFMQHRTGLRNLLYYGDIVAMKNSVENRSPFMDHRLVEFVAKAPYNIMVEPGSDKNVLRRSVYFKNFKEQLDRKKVGFNTPIDDDIRRQMIEELKSSPILNWKILNSSALLRDFESDTFLSKKYERLLFRLYQCHLWNENFML